MNPNAAQFSPSSTAVVEFGGPVKSDVFDHRPQDLIVHESIRQLVQDVQELKERAVTLEHENLSLKQTNVQLKLRVETLEQASINASIAGAVKPNLSGYAASESSSTDFATNVSDTAALEKVTNLQDTVRQLLEKFNEELSIEVAKREALSKQATEIQYGLKNVKGRTGALEAKFKTMSEDIDELEVTVQGIRNENGFMAATTNTSDAGLATYVYDRIDKLEAGVTGIDKLQASINSLRADVEMHRVVLNDMGQKHEAGWVNGGNQNGWGGSRDDDDSDWAVAAAANNENGWANASSSDGGRTVGKSEMPDAQLLMKVMKMAKETKASKVAKEMNRQIDNCSTRDMLYEMYQRHTREMDDATGERLDDLWAYRDRVVCRLALFELYRKAVNEAKSADIGL